MRVYLVVKAEEQIPSNHQLQERVREMFRQVVGGEAPPEPWITDPIAALQKAQELTLLHNHPHAVVEASVEVALNCLHLTVPAPQASTAAGTGPLALY